MYCFFLIHSTSWSRKVDWKKNLFRKISAKLHCLHFIKIYDQNLIWRCLRRAWCWDDGREGVCEDKGVGEGEWECLVVGESRGVEKWRGEYRKYWTALLSMVGLVTHSEWGDEVHGDFQMWFSHPSTISYVKLPKQTLYAKSSISS